MAIRQVGWYRKSGRAAGPRGSKGAKGLRPPRGCLATGPGSRARRVARRRRPAGERWRKAVTPSLRSRTGGRLGRGPRAHGSCRWGERPRAGAWRGMKARAGAWRRRRPVASTAPSPDPVWGQACDFPRHRSPQGGAACRGVRGNICAFPCHPIHNSSNGPLRRAFCGVG